MKKTLAILILLFTLTICLVACTKEETPEKGNSEKEETLEEYIERVGEPYTISYASNDDGTCSVEEIIINSNFKRNFKLEIPEKSPDGDTVVAMDTVGFLEYDNVPRMMAKEDADKLFERLEKAMEASKEDWWDFYYDKFCVYYQPVSLYWIDDKGDLLLDENEDKIEKSEQDREQLLSEFPMLEQVDVLYVLADAYIDLPSQSTFRASMLNYLSKTLTTYLNYTEKERFAIDMLMTSEYEDYQTNYCHCPIYVGSYHIEEIDFPDSIVKYNSGLQGLSDNVYTKFDNAYYVGTNNNQYKILVQATGPNIVSCEVNPSAEIIASYAFYECENLQSVKIPDSVTSIGECAFYYCESLTGIEIPEGLTSIGDYAFASCDGLTSVIIPNSMIYVGKNVFAHNNDIVIYCEAKERPSGWDEEWDDDTGTVVWGYTAD